jgi:Spx/MgsR family transcriptional regulator
MLTIYGIPNCDTVKKSLDWFTKHKIEYVFHNYKKEGVTAALLKDWMSQQDFTLIVNTKSATYKKLSPADQAKCAKAATAVAVLQENTSLIKRPIVTKKGNIIAIGFDPETYASLF